MGLGSDDAMINSLRRENTKQRAEVTRMREEVLRIAEDLERGDSSRTLAASDLRRLLTTR